ncbi:unnamed protein product [Brassica rapa]|uniref:Uncharacterized protein n=1 Tax=Brassica campestris TaxID=3711 RepID=A0A8D9H7Z9_BRACM|nr:unnamed protein product [Brassica rapa]
MKALAEWRGVYYFYDVLSVPWELNMHSQLLKSCYTEGNLSTLYIKGVQFYFTFGRHEEGITLMKRAVYTHAITQAIFLCDAQYFHGIPREWVQRIGKLVRSVKWGWGLWHSDEFRQNRALFISKFVMSFYRCQCATHV